MAVTNVHQDRAVGKALDLCRTQHPIEPGGGDNDARSPNGIVEVGHTAALMPPTGVIMSRACTRFSIMTAGGSQVRLPRSSGRVVTQASVSVPTSSSMSDSSRRA